MDDAVAASLRPIAVALATLYAIFAMAHRLTLPYPHSVVMSVIAGASAVFFAVFLGATRRIDLDARRSHPYAFAFLLVVFVNAEAILVLTGDPLQTTNLILLAVGAGFTILRIAWFVSGAAVIWAGWFAALALHPAERDWPHFGFALVSGFALATIVNIVRRRSTIRLERLRLVEAEAARAELRAARERMEMDRLREQDAFKTQFLNAAAHELGTPLTPIVLQVHLLDRLLEQDQGDERRRSFDTLRRNVRRLEDIIAHLLEAVRLQQGRLGIRPIETPLDTIARDAVAAYEGIARANGKEMTLIARPVSARVDAERVRQVLDILVTNALKFTPAGGRIDVVLDQDGPDARFEVRDTGIGIDPQDLPRLFRPFVQLHPETTTTYGSGLGLYLARGIVEAHDGVLTATSAGLGQGSAFRFTLPLAGPSAPVPPPV